MYDLSSGSVRDVGTGSEPQWSPDGTRFLVCRVDALSWTDLVTGAEEPVPGTEGAFAGALSPDGSILAFSATRFGNPDVSFVRLP